MSGGIAVGPLVAGALPGWRTTYLVLGAVTLLVAALSARALTESRAPRGGRPDLVGPWSSVSPWSPWWRR